MGTFPVNNHGAAVTDCADRETDLYTQWIEDERWKERKKERKKEREREREREIDRCECVG